MKTRLFAIASLAVACIAAGCAVGPNYHPPETTAPPQFANGAQAGFTTNEPVAAWWCAFHDNELTKLVDWAASSNLDLRVATANLLEARALRLGAKADFLPVASGNASYNNNTYSDAALFNAPGAPRRQELYDLGFDATWELDFFGRLRRSYAARTAEIQAAVGARRDVLVSLAAEVARNYFELRGAQDELAVLRRNAEQPDRYPQTHPGAPGRRRRHRTGCRPGAGRGQQHAGSHSAGGIGHCPRHSQNLEY